MKRRHADALSLNQHAEKVAAIFDRQVKGIGGDRWPALSTEDAIAVWQMSHALERLYPGHGLMSSQLERELFTGDRCGVCGSYQDPGCREGC